MKKAAVFISCLSLLFMLACAGASNQESKTKEGVLVGAGVGALLGQIIGGDTEGTLIGAGVGAALGGLAGNQIGTYMDRQEQALRQAVAASEAASIQRSQDVLTATFRADMFFDFDSATLKPGAYSEIDRVAKVLRDFPQTRIRVEGHTDAKGSEVYNQKLSERRARSVTNALGHRGIDPARLVSVGYGETRPISSDDAANRRVSIVIIPVEAG